MSTPVRIGILALQGDVREHHAALTEIGVEPVSIRRASELDSIDGIIVPGGESTTMSRLLVVLGLLEPLREALADGLPAYGSCAGMIMLARDILDTRPDAQHLDALDITVRRNAFGRQVASFETDLDIEGIDGGPMRAVFIRAPWVESSGESVQILGTVPEGPAAGRVVAVRQGDVLATSFHPEVTGDRRVHEYFVEMVRAAQGKR
ncbi:pyridoxal 5'-phosphate synthase glutaminase subunit PdxT [Williamsia sp. D3]|uniref:pyridoxal 5'-phosphate synthase glutaminase subunit PdxT n=1 Tax=Williamsia sp. D3 TaxID=1313067 RepID=UPI000419FA9B|nr:pyridoxal 5'-phosphate synthase glutaminase subunit PdxT [Williamsia sp. D3]